MMADKLRTENVKDLFEEEFKTSFMSIFWYIFYTFFEDVCTVNELISLAQRFEVAGMLRKKHTYNDIAEKTGASTATISRVNRSLSYGNDGYEMVFSRIEQTAE